MSTISNRFTVKNEREAEEQLKALYGRAPIRTGTSRTHVTWFVKNRIASMALASHHRNGAGDPLYLVEVK